MKENKILVFVVIMLLGFVAINCNAQTSNNEQRIIGTWTDGSGTTWVFNTNGTGSSGSDTFVYGITSGEVTFISSSGNMTQRYMYFSPDGKTLILLFGRSDGSRYHLLKK